MKKAFITGVTGQDGSYLCDLLLSKGYEVHGLLRRSSVMNTQRIDHLTLDPKVRNKTLFMHYGDLTDGTNISNLVEKIRPDEIYNCGAQSHVKVSFDVPEHSAQVDGLGVIRILDAVKNYCPEAKIIQFSTSEMYGKVSEIPQTEKTPFYPRSPYASAKVFAYYTVINYREAYGLKAFNAICFNHESERRGSTFVTRKITQGISRIVKGTQEKIVLGNLSAKRDWGYAPEYMEGIYKLAQLDEPDDIVFATGETHTVEEFVVLAFELSGYKINFDGEGLDRVGVDQSGATRIAISPEFYRPTEVDILMGDASKAERILGWKASTTFESLVERMVKYDLSENNSAY